MKVTRIVQQQKRADRYSIFVDEKYAFSLSETALLENKLASGQELTAEQVAEYKQKSSDDKLYNLALRWAALRPRGEGEARDYLKRKEAPAPLAEQITNKLKELGLVNDQQLAEAYIRDSQVLRPAPRRKISAKLKQKRVPEEVINITLDEVGHDEHAVLREVITKKRRQNKYQDDEKLMAYLARQGFNYSDIKDALAEEKSN